jgi:hypothetical protein
MKKLIVGVMLGLMLAVTPLTSADAHSHSHIFVGIGVGGYYPYPAYPYPYYSPYYVAPPPTVVYAPAVVSPPVVAPVTYVAPPPTTVYVPAPVADDQPVTANQTSPTFIDSQGRTCRHFQSTSDNGPAFGTACLQSDGSWRTVE